MNAFGEKFGVPADKRFSGLDGFRKMLASGIDAVAIHTPAWFHPEQSALALDAAKHVFVAKPVAVDVPGTLTIDGLGKKAAAGESFRKALVSDSTNTVAHEYLRHLR